MNPIVNYEINRFFMLFIPDIIKDKLPVFFGSIAVSLVPYTPVNLILFITIFIIVYATDMFGLSSYQKCSCRFNAPETERIYSVVTCLKGSYMLYLPLAYIINYNTLTRYSTHQIHAI